MGGGRPLHIAPDRCDFNHWAFQVRILRFTPGLIIPCGPTIRCCFWAKQVGGFLSNEWFWAAVICAAPFVLFGLFEAFTFGRRKRFEAIARRSKSRPRNGR